MSEWSKIRVKMVKSTTHEGDKLSNGNKQRVANLMSQISFLDYESTLIESLSKYIEYEINK